MLCDIEGYEFELFNTSVLKYLSKYKFELIVEIHHWVEGAIKKYREFLAKASDSFQIYKFNEPIIDFNDRYLLDFNSDNKLLLLSEGRPRGQKFLLLKPLD